MEHLSRLPGGLGCTMDLIGLSSATGNDRRLVLRRYGPWWRESGDDVAEREFAALRQALGGGVPVPEPVWIDRGGIFDEQAVVISYIEGQPLLKLADLVGWARQLAEMLVRVHGIEVDPRGARHLRDLPDSVTEDNVPQRVADHPRGRELWEARRAAFEIAEFPDPCLVHGDFWTGNTLWRDDQLAAIVDWEECGLGDPAFDVAYCAADMRYQGLDDAADHFGETYRSDSGRDLDTYDYWNLVALCRPMPDIAGWLADWQRLGRRALTAEQVRNRHTELIDQALLCQA